MLIGLISDIHDHTANLRRALALLKAEPCTHLLCLGDIASVSTLRLLAELWPHELDTVAGNNDYPQADFCDFCAREAPRIRYHGSSAELDLNGRRIYMVHEPTRALHAAEFGQFDAVFFGHTHQAWHMTDGATLIANPGDLQGRHGAPSFALYDPAAHTLRYMRL